MSIAKEYVAAHGEIPSNDRWSVGKRLLYGLACFSDSFGTRYRDNPYFDNTSLKPMSPEEKTEIEEIWNAWKSGHYINGR